MKIIGVTGGIGSGKSSVSEILRELGAQVLDADRCAREVVEKGEKALDELVGYFGTDILDENGELDRKRLADIAFKDNEKLRVLNSITHKYIIMRMLHKLESARQSNPDGVVVMDVPLPVEHGFLDTVDEVWVVTASRSTRISRILSRGGLSPQEANQRIDSQLGEDRYLAIADEIIDNGGSFEELKKKVYDLYYGKVSKKNQGDVIASNN